MFDSELPDLNWGPIGYYETLQPTALPAELSSDVQATFCFEKTFFLLMNLSINLFSSQIILRTIVQLVQPKFNVKSLFVMRKRKLEDISNTIGRKKELPKCPNVR